MMHKMYKILLSVDYSLSNFIQILRIISLFVLLCHLVDPGFFARRSSNFHFEGEELQDAGSAVV